jgi:pSer/pThr/pTyr-binding forkhead associated (FHA) protein
MARVIDHGLDDVAAVTRSAEPREETVTRFIIEVIEGADTGKQLGVDITRPSPLLVGQGASCELRLADREASRRHASFDVAGLLLRLTELDSTNGTYVNGIRIHDVSLSGGEVVRIG